MADEAVVRIKLEDGSSGSGSATTYNTVRTPNRAGAAGGGQGAPAGGGQATAGTGKPAGFLDTVLDIATQLRGTIGGAFGKLAGAALDVVAAFQKLRDASGAAGAPPSLTGRATADVTPLQEVIARPAGPDPTLAPAIPGTGRQGMARPAPTANPLIPGTGRQGTAPFLEAQPANLPEVLPHQDAFGAQGAAGIMPAVGLAMAAKQASDKIWGEITDASTSAVRGLRTFAVAVANPDANPATAIEGLGSGISATTEKVGKFADAMGLDIPVVKLFGGVIGESVSAVGAFMKALDGLSQRYGEYSPQIATAEAMSDIRQVMGDFRRSQQISGELARYVAARSELQQQFEETKIRLLEKMLPILNNMLENTSRGIDSFAENLAVLKIIAEATTGNIPAAALDLKKLAEEAQKNNLPDNLVDPTTAILRGYTPDQFGFGAVNVPGA